MAVFLLFMAMGSLFGVVVLTLFAISTTNLWHRRFAIAAGAIFCAASGDSIVESIYRLTTGGSHYGREAVYHVPNSSTEVILERSAIHMFLAEYERTLVVREGPRELVRVAAAVDTGGYSRMNLYQISSTEYFLRGVLSSDNYVLDLTKIAVAQDATDEDQMRARFVGAFDRDEKGWRFIPAHERAEQKRRLD